MSALGQQTATLARTYTRQTPSLLRIVGQSIWDTLEAAGRRRATRELRQLAQRWESLDPELAQQFREASRYDTHR
jgi:hypothetical protein